MQPSQPRARSQSGGYSAKKAISDRPGSNSLVAADLKSSIRSTLCSRQRLAITSKLCCTNAITASAFRGQDTRLSAAPQYPRFETDRHRDRVAGSLVVTGRCRDLSIGIHLRILWLSKWRSHCGNAWDHTMRNDQYQKHGVHLGGPMLCQAWHPVTMNESLNAGSLRLTTGGLC